MKNINHIKLLALVLAAFLSTALATTNSFAGCINLTVNLHNLGGNWCDDSDPFDNSCHGYYYKRTTHYNQQKPISGVRVVLKTYGGTVLDDDVSDSNGKVYLCTTLTGSFVIEWYPESDDGRIKVLGSGGGRHRFWFEGIAVTSGTTNHSIFWGSTTLAHPQAHAYYAARMLWTRSLSSSARLTNVYSGLKIYAENTSEGCTTSCADRKEIWLNPGSAAQFQWRVLHEMGHTVADVASRDSRIGVNSTWPKNGLGDDWNNTSVEKMGTAMNEAYGTFIGSTALINYFASTPLQCLSSVDCPNTNDNNMEATPTCSSNNVKRHAQLVKYLWDVYDEGDEVQEPFYEFADAMYEFPNGRGQHEKSEHYVCVAGVCWVDDRDERRLDDFQHNFEQDAGVDTSSAVTRNCL